MEDLCVIKNGWTFRGEEGLEQFGKPVYWLTDKSQLSAFEISVNGGVVLDIESAWRRRFEGIVNLIAEGVTTVPEATFPESAVGRRFAATDNGLIGLVPEEAQVGDSIVVIQGSEVPFILRPYKKKWYLIIGECYIYGIMDGERYDEEVVRECGLQEIEIV
jgi:hypothetical protein